ncbi:MAG: hypothetical protein OEO23_10710, partial [Gemmatimonadota bacterium]|nr:hypothetical protein [Gemmatimonadota bacterium]
SASPGAGADTLPRPSAVAQDFHLWADSIDIRSPGQVLDRVIAVGGARSESVTAEDSIPAGLPEVAREDWMEGDTIVAQFAATRLPPEEGTDTADAEVDIETVTATGRARSLYKLAPSDPSGVPTGGPPALHYVKADMIRIHFRVRQVVRIEVQGQTTGYHFEPIPAPARPDTTAAAPPGPRVPGPVSL